MEVFPLLMILALFALAAENLLANRFYIKGDDRGAGGKKKEAA